MILKCNLISYPFGKFYFKHIYVLPAGTVSLHTLSEQSSAQIPVELFLHWFARHCFPTGTVILTHAT